MSSIINADAVKSRRVRRWTITINNPDMSKEDLQAYLVNSYKVKYLIIGSEIAPTTGTPHFQMYIEFINPATFNQLKKRFPTAHIQASDGSAENNVVYCKKENNYIEFGTPYDTKYINNEEVPYEVIKMLRQGFNIFEIMDKMPNSVNFIVRHFKALNEISRYIDTMGAKMDIPDELLPF